MFRKCNLLIIMEKINPNKNPSRSEKGPYLYSHTCAPFSAAPPHEEAGNKKVAIKHAMFHFY